MSVQLTGISYAGMQCSYSAALMNYKPLNSQRALNNKDGDSISLSAQSLDFQKTVLVANQSSSPDEWKKIIESIKEEYQALKGQIVDTLFNGNDGQKEKTDSIAAADPRTFDETKEIPGLTDYWSADKTAQRIADFATSFAGLFQGSKEDFISMIKDAIEKGFSQAKDINNDLPDPINKLVAKTHALVMDKIDAWAKGQSADSPEAAQPITSA